MLSCSKLARSLMPFANATRVSQLHDLAPYCDPSHDQRPREHVLHAPHVLGQLQRVLAHRPLGLARDLPLRAREVLAVAQLHQRLQLVEVEAEVLAAGLLCALHDGLGALAEVVKVLRAAAEQDVLFHAAQVLLQDEDVELHAVAAVLVQRLDLGRVGDNVRVEQEAKTGRHEFVLTLG
jgi:hypothetical protein